MADAVAAGVKQATEAKDFSELVLDFNGTKIISSMAMGTLFATFQRLKDEGKSMHIINASEKVMNLLRMVNMAEILS